MVQLELSTTEELLHELFSRTTFAGVLISSPVAHREHGQVHSRFDLRTSADLESTIFMLEQSLAKLRNEVENN